MVTRSFAVEHASLVERVTADLTECGVRARRLHTG
jgi:hypothetical protein